MRGILRRGPFIRGLVWLVLGAAPSCALAGAWTQPEGKGLVIISADHSRASERFDEQGRRVPTTDFSKTELRGYIEYGLTDWATLTLQPEWRKKQTGPGMGEDVRGLGRIDGGVRVRLWRDDASVFSVQVAARMPGASDTLAPANGGDTDWEADARVLYGRGFSFLDRHAFADVQLGYRVRFGDPADELRFDLTTGIDVTPSVLALVQSFNSLSLNGAQLPFVETREHKVSASLVYRFDETWSVQVGGVMTVAGSNALAERGAVLGLWRKF